MPFTLLHQNKRNNQKTFLVFSGFSDVKLNGVEEGIRLIRIKDLVAIHHRDEVLRVGEVNDVVCIPRQHVNALDVVARDLELDDLPFGVVQVALLDEAVATDHDEELPFGVVPMLTLGDARLRDVDAHLTAVQCMHQLGEGTPFVDVHLQREGDLLLREIGEIRGVKLLGETAVGNLGDGQGLGLLGEFV